MHDPDQPLDRLLAGQPEPPMVTLAEAAGLTGRHPEALRSMIRRGQLPARRDNRRGWLVSLPRPAEAGQQPAESAGGPAVDRPLTDFQDALAELREEVAELREALARSEAGREAAVAQARAEGEARAAKGEAEAAAQRELAAELRRLLDDTRRPWWQRLVAGRAGKRDY